MGIARLGHGTLATPLTGGRLSKLDESNPLDYLLVYAYCRGVTLEYLRRAERLLSEPARTDIVDYLAAHLNAGVIMRGTGGIRKLRLGTGGNGQK